jgi:hypothetical protein
MKTTFSLFAAMFVLVACSSSVTGADICKRGNELCPTSGGVKFTCNDAEADAYSNKDDVKKCLDAATDCNGALACSFKARK